MEIGRIDKGGKMSITFYQKYREILLKPEVKKQNMSASMAKEESQRNRLRILRLGSIELYKDVKRNIESSVKCGESRLKYTTYKHYGELGILLHNNDVEVAVLCIKEVIHVLDLEGFKCFRDGKYTLNVMW